MIFFRFFISFPLILFLALPWAFSLAFQNLYIALFLLLFQLCLPFLFFLFFLVDSCFLLFLCTFLHFLVVLCIDLFFLPNFHPFLTFYHFFTFFLFFLAPPSGCSLSHSSLPFCTLFHSLSFFWSLSLPYFALFLIFSVILFSGKNSVLL